MVKKKYFDIHEPVFWPASVLIVLFIVAVNAFIVFCLYIGFGRFGKIRLGGDDAEKEFSTPAWFAMLFSAGMGIGILFWGVAEPVTHYINPPFGQGRTLEAAEVLQAELLPVHAVKLKLHYYPMFHGPYTIRLLSTVPIWW